jgi:hypothetical protein
MGSYPEPKNAVLNVDCESAIMDAHADGVKTANPFEMKGRMLRISLQQLEVLVGERTNPSGQRVVTPPKARCRVMVHRRRERPAR